MVLDVTPAVCGNINFLANVTIYLMGEKSQSSSLSLHSFDD